MNTLFFLDLAAGWPRPAFLLVFCKLSFCFSPAYSTPEQLVATAAVLTFFRKSTTFKRRIEAPDPVARLERRRPRKNQKKDRPCL
jgi:hypothetical protein